MLDGALCGLHHIHFGVSFALVEEHIADQEGVLALDHLRTAFVFHVDQFTQGYLHACGCRHQDPLQLIGIVTQLAWVANPHRIALSTFHRGGVHHAPDRGLDGALHVLDGQAVAADGFPIDAQMQVGLAHDAIREHGFGLHRGHFLQDRLEFASEFLDRRQVGSEDLDAHGCAHAGLQHDQTRFDGLQLGRRGDTRQIGGLYHFLPDVGSSVDVSTPIAEVAAAISRDQGVAIECGCERFFLRERIAGGEDETLVPIHLEGLAMALLVHFEFRPVVDDVLVHADRRGIERGLRTAHLAHHHRHFRDRRNTHVQLLHHTVVLLHPRVRHAGGHQQETAFVQGGHEFLAHTGECMDHLAPWSAGLDVPTHSVRSIRKW